MTKKRKQSVRRGYALVYAVWFCSTTLAASIAYLFFRYNLPSQTEMAQWDVAAIPLILGLYVTSSIIYLVISVAGYYFFTLRLFKDNTSERTATMAWLSTFTLLNPLLLAIPFFFDLNPWAVLVCYALLTPALAGFLALRYDGASS
jgi:hypothetical protein